MRSVALLKKGLRRLARRARYVRSGPARYGWEWATRWQYIPQWEAQEARILRRQQALGAFKGSEPRFYPWEAQTSKPAVEYRVPIAYVKPTGAVYCP
jgi:hypothetical protein